MTRPASSARAHNADGHRAKAAESVPGRQKTVSIMTSCDDNLAPYVMPQLASAAVNLKDYAVNFFLFHSRISASNIENLRRLAGNFDNLTFSEVKITDTEPYEKIAYRGGLWPHEAYFTLCCHEYLPGSVDRILYIDAGDVIINGDISPYYFHDFEGNSLIATLAAFTMDMDAIKARAKNDVNELNKLLSLFEAVSKGDLTAPGGRDIIRPYEQKDLNDSDSLEIMLKLGVFNSGCYVINTRKFREEGRTIKEYLDLFDVLCELYPDRRQIYFGDQSFMSAAFVGDIKYFGYPENFDLGFSPYNFGIWFMEGEKTPDYAPVVPHLTGINYLKPWEARFSAEEIAKYRFGQGHNVYHAPFRLNARQFELFEAWWKYCEMTPLYGELNEKAAISARALEENYLPLCQWYNELAESYIRDAGKKPPRRLKHRLANDERLSF